MNAKILRAIIGFLRTLLPFKKALPPEISTVKEQVLLLLDWENIRIPLSEVFGYEDIRIKDRLTALIKWAKGIGNLWGHGVIDRFGKISDGHGFVFAPTHLNGPDEDMLNKLGFIIVICPKQTLDKPRVNNKNGNWETIVDTVDDTIIDFALATTACQCTVKTLCLASGDKDYIPLFKEMEKRGIKRALAPSTNQSIARNRELPNMVDRHPVTHKKMIYMLDQAV